MRCSKDCFPLCDFCIHFNMFKTEEGHNIDGEGYCGLHRKNVDAGEHCEKFFCESVEPYQNKVIERNTVVTERDGIK